MSLEISLFEDLLDDFVRVIRAELIRKSCLGSTIVGARHARSRNSEQLLVDCGDVDAQGAHVEGIESLPASDEDLEC